MRLAVAGFLHESNTFNPLKADRAAFAAGTLALGPGFEAECEVRPVEFLAP